MGKKRTKKVGPTRGLGARYGVTLRKRYREIIIEMKRRHKCPQCGFMTVKRESVGIWICRKCGYKFTGGAYTPFTKIGTTAKRVAARGA
ncbi:TPA: 50S ribosomal protein L37ae [Candidatus Bathyarchaeota archaeon]|nr:50S ribosomal protein L37ae [Candidatus Bathyarchaeota archaeon]